MRRDPGQMHPIALVLIAAGYIATAIWVLWSTVIAFIGGKLPIFGWKLNGGILWGLSWICILWPIAFGVNFLLSSLLNELVWWLDRQLRTLIKGK